MSKTLSVEMSVDQLRKQAEAQRTRVDEASAGAPSPPASELLQQTHATLDDLNDKLEQFRQELNECSCARPDRPAERLILGHAPIATRLATACLLVLIGAVAGAAYTEWRSWVVSQAMPVKRVPAERRAGADAAPPETAFMSVDALELLPAPPAREPVGWEVGNDSAVRPAWVEFGQGDSPRSVDKTPARVDDQEQRLERPTSAGEGAGVPPRPAQRDTKAYRPSAPSTPDEQIQWHVDSCSKCLTTG